MQSRRRAGAFQLRRSSRAAKRKVGTVIKNHAGLSLPAAVYYDFPVTAAEETRDSGIKVRGAGARIKRIITSATTLLLASSPPVPTLEPRPGLPIISLPRQSSPSSPCGTAIPSVVNAADRAASLDSSYSTTSRPCPLYGLVHRYKFTPYRHTQLRVIYFQSCRKSTEINSLRDFMFVILSVFLFFFHYNLSLSDVREFFAPFNSRSRLSEQEKITDYQRFP